MEVSITVQNVARDITFETDDAPEVVADAVRRALGSPDAVLELEDNKGRKILVPARALGWVQIGEGERGRVGFVPS